jgi:amidohydrolase
MKLSDSFLEELISFRHQLHQFPEISNQEEETANRVVQFVQQFQPDKIHENVGGHGVLVVFNGKETGQTTAFRAELDALPILEEPTDILVYKSKIEENGHLCGHDGHMTMVLSLLEELSANPIKSGKVVLLFQPAEETGEGAARMIADKRYQELSIDAIFALHNVPRYEMGKVLTRQSHFAAASKGMIIKLKGKTAHAAEPQNGINPAVAISKLVEYISGLKQNFKSKDFAIVTIVHLKVGEVAFGISPADGLVMLTLRSYLNEDMEALTTNIQNKVEQLAKVEQLQLSIEETEVFPATVNHSENTVMVEKAAKEHEIETEELSQPFSWSEDFGHFLNNTKGAMFGLGSGKNQPALHHSNYNFPDELISVGNRIYSSIIQQINR